MWDTSTVVSELRVPWNLAWMGQDQLLVTERRGIISRVEVNTGVVTRLLEMDDVAEELQSGLMGMAIHPSWPDSQVVFAMYSYYTPNFQIMMRLVRLRYEALQDTLLLDRVLLESIPGGSSSLGGRLLATPDGYLLASIGDLELGGVAQDSANLNGKVLRLNLDGSIPADNPLAGSPIYTLGHRNVQGLARSPEGRVYASEHGPSANDEVNLLEAGRNYGWPMVLGFCDPSSQSLCDSYSIRDPLLTWSPPIAPAGMAYWEGQGEPSLLLASLRGQQLVRLRLSEDGLGITSEESLLDGAIGRIRDVVVSPEGRIFVCTSNQDILGVPRPGDDRIVEVTMTTASLADSHLLAISANEVEDHVWNISLPETFPGGTLDLISTAGVQLATQPLPRNLAEVTVDLTPRSSGIYVLYVHSASGYWYQKVLCR